MRVKRRHDLRLSTHAARVFRYVDRVACPTGPTLNKDRAVLRAQDESAFFVRRMTSWLRFEPCVSHRLKHTIIVEQAHDAASSEVPPVWQTRQIPFAARYRSASRAAMQPVPAEVIAWR